MVPQAQDKWWLISKIKQPWRKNLRQLKLFRVMDFRGITHPRHAGLPPMLPVNSGQPHFQMIVPCSQMTLKRISSYCQPVTIYYHPIFKEQDKDNN